MLLYYLIWKANIILKIAYINTYPYGSTGAVMKQCAELADKNENDTRIYISTESKKKGIYDDCRYWGYSIDNLMHYYLCLFTGYNGCFSTIGTKKMIKELESYNPDILHLHNLHNCYINLPVLFLYIKKNNIKVVWTLHDCWAYTGQCTHYTKIGCNKWKQGCYSCPQYMNYPKSYIDRTKTMYQLKKKWFTGIKDMTIVTPSKWLASEVKQSYLKEYPIQVINNGIDLTIFKPSISLSYEKIKKTGKYIVLGVAYSWDNSKGLDVFIYLSRKLSSNYQIILVGTDDKVETILPKNIISIKRTSDKKGMAALYSIADVFVNPTREDNYPTVNMEALACGTPVITFQTGGSAEIIDRTCGISVPVDDIDSLHQGIIDICEKKLFTRQVCVSKAKLFDKDISSKKYLELYERI